MTGALRAAVVACLEKVQRREIELDRVKETVDDLWAEQAARAVRVGSPLEGAAKELLMAAIKLGPAIVEKLILPKVP
jgi:hypothetical protein